MKILLFSIEGNIGSGKSTFIKNLKKIDFSNRIKGRRELRAMIEPPWKVIYLSEPVGEWTDIKDENDETILEKFYKNQNRYSFAFQMMAYISRINQLMETIERLKRENERGEREEKETYKNEKKYIIITERSVYTDKNVFAKMLRDDGKIESVEYQIYLKWFDNFTKNIEFNGNIYLQADTKVCEERIKKRNRSGENMSSEYLNNCNLYHNKWLLGDEYREKILRINGNEDYDEKLPEKWLDETIKYINSCITEILLSDSYSRLSLWQQGIRTWTDFNWVGRCKYPIGGSDLDLSNAI